MTPRRPDLVGRTLGSYRLLKELGVGGMGAVFLGEHQSIGKKAAIKVLHRAIASDREVVQRFFNEARAVNQIGHPGIIDIFDFGEDATFGAYLVMDFLEGEPLSTRLLRERLALPSAARIVVKIASALQAAHDAGIVHRDLKPDNVFLVPDPDHPGEERVVLLDFGIAKLKPEALAGGERRTQTGMLLGTPRYMSPEQCHGAKALDHRADIYALGVLAYELVCGRPPFDHQGLGQLMSAHMMEPPPPPRRFAPELPVALETAILCALEKDPRARFFSMAALGNAVAQAAGLASPSLITAAPPATLAGDVDPLGPTIGTPGPALAAAVSGTIAAGPRPPFTLASTPPPTLASTPPPTLASTPPPTLASTPPPTLASTPPSGSTFARRPPALVLGALAAVSALGVGAWLTFRSDQPAAQRSGVGAGDAGPRREARAEPRLPPARPAPAGSAERCSRGDNASCYAEARRLFLLKTKAARAEARELLQRACDGNVAAACLGLGTMALTGAKPDFALATQRYRKACTLGDGKACFYLARFYRDGRGARRDRHEAASLGKRACALGYAKACPVP